MFETVRFRRAGGGRCFAWAGLVPVVGVGAVAAEVRRRLPDVPALKLHTLLYYCQGHHLATFGSPLFAEPVSAWDVGPVVGALWGLEAAAAPPPAPAPGGLDNATLNTVGYVISRYGALSVADLARLARAEAPWREADARRRPRSSVPLSNDALAAFFAEALKRDDEVPPTLDSDALSDWLAGAADGPLDPAADSLARLASMLVGD